MEQPGCGTALAVTAKAIMSSTGSGAPTDIARIIVRIRGMNVMLDSDLAALYGVATRVLNQAVRRNPARFPADFAFRLTPGEARAVARASLRSQSVILKLGRGTLRTQSVLSEPRGVHRKYPPHAFTEQGVAMLSSVLRSPRAIAVNIEIMRAFVQLRRLLDSNAELARKLADLERRHDSQFKVVFDAIRQLMAPPLKPGRRIGFREGT
jgi:hypothetical protein